MSRIGKKPINIPSGVTVAVNNSVVSVKGPKGEQEVSFDAELAVEVEGAEIVISRPTESKKHKSMHGLYRSLINNAVEGVSNGFTIKLELVGVGYKAVCTNNVLELSLGYSHSIYFALPEEVKGDAQTEKGKNPIVTLVSNDKQLIGQVAAKIRSLRKVEPYKGKGVRFVGEQIIRKAGKTAAK